MRFTIDQRYAVDADQVARAYTDPALYAAHPDGPKLARPRWWPTRPTGTTCCSRSATGSAASCRRRRGPCST